jgi:hypothetical protein
VNALMSRRIFSAAWSPGRVFWLYGDCVRPVSFRTAVGRNRGRDSSCGFLHCAAGPHTDRGIRLFDLNLRGKTVLLKPNLAVHSGR